MKKILKSKHIYFVLMLSLVIFTMIYPDMYLASEAAKQQVIGKLSGFSSLFMDMISVLGQIYTLWGIAEWGLAWHESNGTMGGQSFKRIFGGLVVVLSPQILAIIA